MNTKKIEKRLADQLDTGETVRVVTPFGLKVDKTALGKSIGTAAGLAVAGSLIAGGGIGVVTLPAAWCVATDRRLLVLEKVTAGLFQNPVGMLLLEAPLEIVVPAGPEGAMQTITLRDCDSGAEMLQLKGGLAGGRRAQSFVDLLRAC